ncbi:MAG: hypothetical protein M1830_004590 [Pleopsidium flavum]|nr:MAG: hypothetical protein M1830_004590 [Pleopsidium flavum]
MAVNRTAPSADNAAPEAQNIPAPAEASFKRLARSEPPLNSSVDSDEGISEDEGLQNVQYSPQHDEQCIIGISISRTQTRLISPQTPAAEKAAAVNDAEDERFANGETVDGTTGSPLSNAVLEHPFTLKALGEPYPADCQDAPGPHVRLSENNALTLPSPWHSSQKTRERSNPHRVALKGSIAANRSRSSSGPSGMINDLNIKKFLPTFNLPTLPRNSSFSQFSFPSMATLFTGHKDQPGSDGSFGRPKRANSMLTTFKTPLEPPSSQPSVREQQVSHDHPGSNPQAAEYCPPGTSTRVGTTGTVPITVQDRTSDDEQIASLHSPQERRRELRRATSDISLSLRRSMSLASSLGDNTRWDNVQDQVNSRFKAIIDSFQDSSLKMPKMPSINFHPFKPDFVIQSRTSTGIGDGGAHRVANMNGSTEPVLSKTSRQSSSNQPTYEISQQVPPKNSYPHFSRALENLEGDVVIMGGYRGSILRSAKPPHRQLWVPVKVGLNLRKVNLEVGLNPEDEENMEDQIIPSGMLTHIGPVDMSRRLFKRLRKCDNARNGKLRIWDYGYDWRLSPHLLSKKLIKFLEGLPSNTPGVAPGLTGATVIAHSLGGLITRHAVNQRPELFAGVVYAGVPQACVNILGPIRNGDEVLLSSRVLTAQVNFTLRTSFLLLPEDGKCFMDKETKEDYPVDFFDVNSWIKYRFSPCIAPPLPPIIRYEKKSLIGSVYGSLPSIQLPGKRTSGSFTPRKESSPDRSSSFTASAKEAVKNTGDTATTKAANLATESTTNNNDHTLAMQMGSAPSDPISPSVSTTVTVPRDAALTYLRRTLYQTLLFKTELHHLPSHTQTNRYPPIAVLYGKSVPTVYGAKVAGRDGIKRTDAYDDLAFAGGDGVCLATAAMAPRGYVVEKGGRVASGRGHVTLLGDLEGVGRCLRAVIEGRRRGIGLGLGVDGG